MQFALLGPLEVHHGERLLALGGAKQRALLAMLLLNSNQVVSRDRLVDGLWGEFPPATAAHTIETYVSRLRRLFHEAGADDILLTRPPGYLLRVEPDAVDVHRFDDMLKRGRQALAEARPTEAAQLLTAALALFRGPPLDDVAFFPFAQPETNRLENQRLSALEDRLDADLAAGRSAELVAELETLAAAHPLRERLRGQLMLALYRGGRQVDALTAYTKHRQFLADELSVEPGVALREIERSILQHDPALHVAVTSSTSAQVAGTVRRDANDANQPQPTALVPRTPEPPQPETAVNGGLRDGRSVRIRRRAYVVVVTALAVLGSLLAARLLATGDKPLQPRLVSADSLGILDPTKAAVVGELALPSRPERIVQGVGSLWATSYVGQTVARIDPAKRAVQQVIQVDGGPSGIVIAAGAVWVASALSGTVARIDPTTNRVVQTIPVGNGVSGITYGEGLIWVTSARDRSVVGISAKTGAVVRRIGLGASPTDLVFGAGALWVTSQSAGTVYRIDPTGRDVVPIAVGRGPSALALGDGVVWVANSLDGTVSRIDTARDTVTATLEVGRSPVAVAVSPHGVWIADSTAGTLVEVDPAGPSVTSTIEVGGPPASLAVVGGAVWFGTGDSGETHRGGTLRVAAVVQRLDSIDPGMAFFLFPPQLLGMTNDGLVTLKHVGASAGTQIVPDLAVSLPTPTANGRSYRFGIRTGIRYSNGSTIRPKDFRRAIERLFRIGSTGASFFTGIVGADQCVRRPATCDLSRGIITDDATNALTFHLVRPDPDFLYKLTLSFSDAVPAGTPNHDVGNHPLPSTGPYVIDRYVPGRVLRLVRNPMFREWSAAAQPDGYPNRIVWRFGMTSDQVVSAIEAGTADWGVYTFPFAPPGNRVEQILTQYADQVHVDPLTETEYYALHTDSQPFDDVRVRRALNLAVDRNRMVVLYGGPALATATCQVLPPGIPGHQPYCPYTAVQNASGSYAGPRLAEARRLVSASGTTGQRVRVLTDPNLPATHYLVSVLKSLGYRASELVATGKRFDVLNSSPTTHIAISQGGWAADYPSASDFITLMLSCASPGSAEVTRNASGFCDHRLDARMASATMLQQTDPQQASRSWAAIDHDLTGRAPWLATVNLNAVGFVARRVGDYQFHPQWGPLVDQFWVR